MSDDRKTEIRAALRAEDVANHLGIKLRWSGQWGRSRRCGRTDHSSDAFGVSRHGFFHCWACDEGGDLLKLLAIGEGLDIREDFGKVIELAASLAGLDLEDDFGGVERPAPAPKERPPIPDVEPIEGRLAAARKRAAWVWSRLIDVHTAGERGLVALKYLEQIRGIPAGSIMSHEDIRDTPMRLTSAEIAASMERAPDLGRLAKMFSWPGVAIPVRSPIDGALVDIRIRRFEPRGDQPKIIGMLGGVTSSPATEGKGRELLGCYGFPHEIRSDLVVVVEGLVDYLTALCVWPHADVLGAVESGSLSLVAKLAALELARGGDTGRLLIVEHADGFGKAGDRAINEEPNAAAKLAVSILGPRRVGWIFCDGIGDDGTPHNDLNDLYRSSRGVPAPTWWSELGEAVA